MSNPQQRREFFDSVYTGPAPWDVEGPQPDLISLLDEYPPPAGRVLDVGCGTGDLVIALARRGMRVVGVDLAAAAIERAREKLAAEPELAERVEFRLADALHPSQLGERFGAIVDSGFYHVFEQDERDAFAAELGECLVLGGRYYLLGFAVDFGLPNTPREVTEDELRRRFSADAGWRVLTVRPGRFITRLFQPVAAIAACIERDFVMPAKAGIHEG